MKFRNKMSVAKHFLLVGSLFIVLAFVIKPRLVWAMQRNIAFTTAIPVLLNDTNVQRVLGSASDPNRDPRINYLHGRLFILHDEAIPAIQALQEAIKETGVDSSLGWSELGYAYYLNEQDESALEAWFRSGVASLWSGQLANKGTRELVSGNNPAATRDLSLSIELDSGNPAAYYRVAYAYWGVADQGQAKKYLHQGLLLDNSNSIDRAYAFGRYSVLVGDNETAVIEFTRVVNAKPSDVWPRLFLADALVAVGKLEDALDQYSEIVILDPGLSIAWVQLARAQAKLGQREAAIQSYSRALILEPGNRVWQSELEQLANQ